jgi:hypothetical protein
MDNASKYDRVNELHFSKHIPFGNRLWRPVFGTDRRISGSGGIRQLENSLGRCPLFHFADLRPF